MKPSSSPFKTFYAEVAAIAAAAEAEVRAQTPPNGDTSPTYYCPACPQTRAIRRDMRSHLEMCEKYRAFVIGCVRRADLAEV